MGGAARSWRVTFYQLVRALFGPVGRFYFHLKVEGLEHVPPTGAALMAANHVSWLDPAVLGSASPRPIRFLIHREVYEPPLTRWFYAGMKAIPVEPGSRDRRWMREALSTLARGGIIGVFPQGAGLASAEARAAMPGVLRLSQKSGAPVLPAGVTGTLEAWPPGSRLPRAGRVTVRFGPPYDPWEGASRPGRETMEKVLEVLMAKIRGLQQEERA